LMRAPRGRPLQRWRLETAAAGAQTAEDGLWWTQLRAAQALESEPVAALAAYDVLLAAATPTWARDIAALRAGVLLNGLKQFEASRRRLAGAAEASALLRGLDGESLRLTALRYLALEGLARRDPGRLQQLLDEAEDGTRLADGDWAGPARVLLAVAGDLALSQSLRLDSAERMRLDRAAATARQGLGLATALPTDGVAAVDAQLVWRGGGQIALFPMTALIEPPPPGFPHGFDLRVQPRGEALPVGAERLAEPLEGWIVAPRPLEDPTRDAAWWLAWALAVGAATYLAGAWAVVRGWRRSRAVAQQQAHFTAAVSHEMKTPIASVRAMAELLADGAGTDPARIQQYAQRIEAEMQRLGATVRNVLDAARIERDGLAVHRRPADPALLAHAVADSLRPALERKRLVFDVAIEPAPGLLSLDAGALEGALLNLLDNAAKFSESGGGVLLRAGPTSDGGYRFEVLDRGLGLGTSNLESLFEPYVRGETARLAAVPGIGLGLAIAREAVRAHGGDLVAQARPGGGAAFTIVLPGESPR
ncbi:MAG: HAMP domain-containing sensor histidine kinase, partial [Planctomycetota bacterium]|nr:HAMP domain-containing sensor histidine kinase [Planctomycetota bacterium]